MDNQRGNIENSFIIGKSTAPDTWLQLLERGLKFIPTPNAWDHHIWTSEVDTILNKITNHIWFSDKQSSRTNNDQEAYQNIRRPFTTSWTCRVSALKDFEANLIRNLRMDLYNITPKNTRHNLSSAERNTIRDLKAQTKWIIKPADKGSGTVLWGRHLYIKEADRQLSLAYYQKLECSKLTKTCKLIAKCLTDLNRKGLITSAEKKAMTQTNPREAEFYLLPKIHKSKTNPPGRPIMSGNGHPTEWISAWVDYKIQPLMLKLPTFLKDTTDLLQHFANIKLTANTRIISLDVTSLYTNIPQRLGINSIRTVGAALDPDVDYTTVADLAQLVLENNTFKFNGDHYI